MVELPKGMGRMKSREGTVVDADDLMQNIIDMAREMTKERGHIEGMTKGEQEELFATIGLGGLKYFLLKVDPSKKLIFDPTDEEAIKLQGNTGPFMQYTHARIQSLLRKGGEVGAWNNATLESEEKEILKHLSLFPSVLEEAAASYSPALLANYLYDLAKLYNTFFQSIPILIEENEDLRNMRLVMSRNVAKVIKLGMGLLGIAVPNRM
jgi:arginyl-tRNA synthetase